ncbi:hypothetical protein [Amycolatopsis nigrescens]|uniref:hypothetical protein n=1 Tax=Amycolatopsis nigrescens TaxID=381445 RepID=UPI00038086CE|nr:hypothetical protein [Amycolatopsis nigrescens]
MTNLVGWLNYWQPLPAGTEGRLQRPNWLLGHAPARNERLLVGATAVGGTVAVCLLAARSGVSWAWWQWLIVAVIAVDMVGGPVANALRGAKRLYHSPLPASATPLQRLLHNRLAFTIMHVQPFIVAAFLPGHAWLWATAIYGIAVLGVLAVALAPAQLAEPVAFAAATVALVVVPTLTAPAGMAWLGYVHVVKLVLAHAVPDHRRS